MLGLNSAGGFVLILGLCVVLGSNGADDDSGLFLHRSRREPEDTEPGIVMFDDDDVGSGSGPSYGDRYGIHEELKPEGCSSSVFGCCADNVTFARGEDKKGCPETVQVIGGCAGTRHGCCDDGVTSASGPAKLGCPETNTARPLVGGCAGTRHGCCVDGVTSASGPGGQGCPENRVGGCRGTRFGCCRDGVSVARGENYLGCEENPMVRCRRTRYGCCQDGRTPARGPEKQGCPELRVKQVRCGSSRYGCCPDGVSVAQGPDQEGCADFKGEYCSFPKDPGGCSDYSRQWFYSVEYGYCREFWYGGCKGNGNRFSTKEECQEKCVKVTGPERCNLPMIKGPCRAKMNRYYFDAKEGQCKPFVYGGCRSNTNNFNTHGECSAACNGKVSTQPKSKACDSRPCQNGFACTDQDDGSYTCACNPDWGQNCQTPPNYWCFSDNECGRGLKCVRERTCSGSNCHIYARCSVSSGRYTCDTKRCSDKQDCVNDASIADGHFCIDKMRNPRPSPVVLDCRYSRFGCCDDRRTPAASPNKENCPRSCLNSVFGCCPDNRTPASGPDYDGCPVEGSGDLPCERTEFGCCADGATPAQGRRGEGCEDTTDTERPTPTQRPRVPVRPPVRPAVTTTRRPTVDTVKCAAPASSRKCTEYAIKWRYDTDKMRCVRFWWGGCRDNGNMFESERDCDDQCRRRRPVVVTPAPTEPDFVDICDMPKDPGPCRASKPRFYFDANERACKNFIYGGCRGNDNNFLSLDACRRECLKDSRPATEPTPPESTLAPPSNANMRISGASRVNEGESIRLICQYMGPTSVDIDWFKDGQQLTRTSNLYTRQSVIRSDQSDPRRGVQLRSDLTVRVARSEDEGTYLCKSSDNKVQSLRVGVDRGRPQTPAPATRRPTVVDNNSYNNMNGSSTVRQGETITITCTARGPRRPSSMEWFINGRLVNPRVGTAKVASRMAREDPLILVSTLSIENAGENNEGMYYCRSRPYGDLQKMEIKVIQTGVPVTRAPVTRAPVTRAPVTRAPVTRPPVTRAPVTRPPVTRAPVATTSKPETSEDVCMMPEETGRCQASFPRWRYNHLEGRCVQFIFGGCGGNSNNFESQAACENYCQAKEICFQPKKIGMCRAAMPRFYFDASQEKCAQFIFGGCRPNTNNFMTMEACERKCSQYIRTSPTTTDNNNNNNNTTQPEENVCDILPEKGTCRGYYIKWYYRKSRNQCSRFVYTGCDGNGNRFDTESQCQSRCVGSTTTTDNRIPDNRRTRRPFQPRPTTQRPPIRDVPVQCTYPQDRGSCSDYKILWRYDTTNRRCIRFYYGGCGGNENRFESQSECEQVCIRGIVPVRPVTPRPTQRPVSCQYSRYGCCRDGRTTAVDAQRSNCPAPVTPQPTPRPTQRPVSCQYSRYGCCRDGRTTAIDAQRSNCPTPVTPRPTPRPTQRPVPCQYSRYGCCRDGRTAATDAQRSNCPGTPTVDRDYNKILARAATDVTLQCPMRGVGVSWYREGFILSPNDRFIMYDNGTLVLRELTDDMAGYYACRFTGSNNRPQLERFRVEINRPLTIVRGPTQINLKPGENGFLHCQASGNPTPQVSWRRDGQPLRTTTRHNVYNNGTLILSNAQPADEGRYECVAENGVSQPVSRVITLSIKESIEAKIERHAGVFLEGDSITLTCRANGYPQPTVSWEKEGRRISNENRRTVRDGQLIVRSASFEDAGIYKCVASNDKGSITDFTTVQIKPQTPETKCEDTMPATKCHLITAGRLCGVRWFGKQCCQSCRNAGYL